MQILNYLDTSADRAIATPWADLPSGLPEGIVAWVVQGIRRRVRLFTHAVARMSGDLDRVSDRADDDMDLFAAINPLLVVSGFVVGMLVGLTGVGGGSLMTPIFVLLFGVHATTAVGTDLLYAAITKTGGALTHGLKGTGGLARHRPARCRQYPGNNPDALRAPYLEHQGQRLSAPDHHRFGHRPCHDRGLRPVASVAASADRDAACGSRDPWWTATLTTFAGLLLGVFVTLSSVGAGAIGMTALVLLYPRTPIARLVGSDIAHAVPLTLIAGVGHWLLGSVDWMLLGSLVIGSLPGIFFGSHLSARVPDKVLRPVLATILVIVGVRMLRA